MIGRRIADAPVHALEFRVVRADLPRGRAASLPGVARPGVRVRLARLRDRLEAPALLARCGVERDDEAAGGVVAAGIADHDHAVDRERRAGEAVTFLVAR